MKNPICYTQPYILFNVPTFFYLSLLTCLKCVPVFVLTVYSIIISFEFYKSSSTITLSSIYQNNIVWETPQDRIQIAAVLDTYRVII